MHGSKNNHDTCRVRDISDMSEHDHIIVPSLQSIAYDAFATLTRCVLMCCVVTIRRIVQLHVFIYPIVKWTHMLYYVTCYIHYDI